MKLGEKFYNDAGDIMETEECQERDSENEEVKTDMTPVVGKFTSH